MIRFVFALFLLVPLFSFAETSQELIAKGTPTPALITCYAPGPNDNIEGPWATSRPRPDGKGNTPMTLDCVRKKECKYVTLAANEAFYGRYFYIGTVRYASPIKEADGKGREYVLENVIGYVHDIGPAFQAGKCAKYGTCSDIGRKFDVALGDFRGWNSRNASQFVDGQKFCRNSTMTFYQIGGAPVNPPSVTSQDTGNQNIAIVPGSAAGTYFGPYGLGVQPYASPLAFASQQGASPSSAIASQSTNQSTALTPTSVSPTAVSSLLSGGSQAAVTSAQVQTVFPTGVSASSIFVQPQNPRRGESVLVSWTSVNMKSSCVVTTHGTQIGDGTEGTKRIVIPQNATGNTTFIYSCIGGNGDTKTVSQTITPQ